MTWLELTGAAAIYVVCIFLLGYTGGLLTLLLNRKGGLESLVLIPVVGIAIWLIGAVCGAVWLGIKIGQMQ
jgi:hypothetical protein